MRALTSPGRSGSVQHSNLFYLFRPSTTMMASRGVWVHWWDSSSASSLETISILYDYDHTILSSSLSQRLFLDWAAPSHRLPVDTVTHRTQDDRRRRQDLFLPNRSATSHHHSDWMVTSSHPSVRWVRYPVGLIVVFRLFYPPTANEIMTVSFLLPLSTLLIHVSLPCGVNVPLFSLLPRLFSNWRKEKYYWGSSTNYVDFEGEGQPLLSCLNS